MSAQSVSVECHQCRRVTPMSTPPARWSQNADGLRLTLPAMKYASPTSSDTTYDHPPPLETKSVTKNQPTVAEISVMNGNSQRRRSLQAAARMRSSSERCATDQPPNGEFQCFSQPNQFHALPTNTAHAITEAKAKIPAAVQRPRRRSDSAMPDRTTRMSSAHAVSAPLPKWPDRYVRAEIAAPRTVSPPAYTRNEDVFQTGFRTACIIRLAADGLPAAGLEQLARVERCGGDPHHRLAQPRGDPRQDLCVLEVCRRLDDRLRAPFGIAGLEDARADEDAVGAELHAQRGVGGRRDPARGERHHRQLPVLGDPLLELIRRTQLLRLGVEILLAQRAELAN